MKTMYLRFIGMMLPIVSYGELTAENEVETQKIYVESSQLYFADREMFAFVAGEWVSVDSI